MNEYINRAITSVFTFGTVFLLVRGCNSEMQIAPDYEHRERENAVEKELSPNFAPEKQNIASSVAEAQKRLDELVDYHVYDRHFALNDEQEMKRYFACLEEWLDVNLNNPLAHNETVEKFAGGLTFNRGSPESKARYLYKFIHNHHVYFSSSRTLPGETIKIYQDTMKGVRSVYAVHVKEDKNGFQLKKEKMIGLFGDCFSLSCLYVASLRSLGITDAYICTVTIDQKGLNYLDKMANKAGIGHACAVVKIDGNFVVVDVLAPDGYGYSYREIRVLNDVETVTEHYRGVREQRDMPFPLRKLVEIHPFEFETRLHVSDNSSGQEALDHARMAVALKRNYLTLAKLALEYLANKDYMKAEKYILESIELCCRYSVAHGVHAKIFYDTKRYTEALKAVKTAIVYRKHSPHLLALKKRILGQLSLRVVNGGVSDPLANVVLSLYVSAALLLMVLMMVFKVHRVHRPRIFKYRFLPARWKQQNRKCE